MVDRGLCKFTAKANFAEAAGAKAVLIINNQKGNHNILFLLFFFLYFLFFFFFLMSNLVVILDGNVTCDQPVRWRHFEVTNLSPFCVETHYF